MGGPGSVDRGRVGHRLGSVSRHGLGGVGGGGLVGGGGVGPGLAGVGHIGDIAGVGVGHIILDSLDAAVREGHVVMAVGGISVAGLFGPKVGASIVISNFIGILVDGGLLLVGGGGGPVGGRVGGRGRGDGQGEDGEGDEGLHVDLVVVLMCSKSELDAVEASKPSFYSQFPAAKKGADGWMDITHVRIRARAA